MGMGIAQPAEIARRARDLADKREKQAETTAAPQVREQLLATARNYRALAAELDRKIARPKLLRDTPLAPLPPSPLP